MVKSEKKTRDIVWLRLRGYHVVALKPELDEQAIELERSIRDGIPAYPDLARADFYDLARGEGWAYIHVYRDGRTVYLVASSLSMFHSLSGDGTDEWKAEDAEMPASDLRPHRHQGQNALQFR